MNEKLEKALESIASKWLDCPFLAKYEKLGEEYEKQIKEASK